MMNTANVLTVCVITPSLCKWLMFMHFRSFQILIWYIFYQFLVMFHILAYSWLELHTIAQHLYPHNDLIDLALKFSVPVSQPDFGTPVIDATFALEHLARIYLKRWMPLQTDDWNYNCSCKGGL